ncbi:hypothetical protein [Pedobacter sp.]
MVLKDKMHFITMSYSSAIETVNHLIAAFDLDLLQKNMCIFVSNWMKLRIS